MTPEQIFAVPGAPLEIRWALAEHKDWAITATALTSQFWLVTRDGQGRWQARDVAAIGDPAKIPLPVDISITADAKGLWVNTFMDGTTHYFDLTDPEHPRETYSKHTGSQVNMVSQSWDGKRVYITSSLLSKWDKSGRVADAVLLDGAGRSQSLSALSRGKITLLTFFYTYCVDPLGCPFAHVTLAQLRDRVRGDRTLGRVRFISISLDPSHDTPTAIAAYGREFDVVPAFDWRFLTARCVSGLLSVLDDFGQDVSVDVDERGRATRTLHHMLKIFLIDAGGEVREIYTLAFVQPQVMFNDIKTLALQAP